MEKRRLGASRIEVSVLGIGTWAMSGYVPAWGVVDDNESVAAIREALDGGVNLLDTAPIYGDGHSETIVGRAIAGRRDEVVLATKCGLLPSPSGGEPRRCLARDSILRECDASLRRLQTDVIDVYQCHWPDPKTPLRETMEALVALLQMGKIRGIGLSNFSCEQMAAAKEFGPVHSIQPPFSLLTRRAAADLLPYCREHEMGVLAYGPLAKGLLTGKFSADSQIRGVRAEDPEFTGARFRQNLDFVDRLRPMAARYGKTVGQLALNWVIHQPGITAALFGAKRPSQVVENLGASGWSIDAADLARIDELLHEL
jgi:aryl-alcohol dehydrogenase-like predicted oxidoreductase